MKSDLIAVKTIENKIFTIRGQKVMIDRDLAELYGVELKRLNEAVKRNIERFPSDFMFQLTQDEWDNLRSQIATANSNISKMRLKKSDFKFKYNPQVMSIHSHTEADAPSLSISLRRRLLFCREYFQDAEKISPWILQDRL